MSSPITILVSSDSFLIQRELARIQKEVLGEAPLDFNLEKFTAKNSIDSILNSCAMLPMMGERRLVIVTEAETFNKDEFEKLKSYFEKPFDSACLVLVTTKIDKRLKIWQVASQKGWVIELKIPYPNEMPQWISREAGLKGLKMTYQVAQALADLIGVNLMAQIGALEKLELYVHPSKEIKKEDVEALVGPFLNQSVFDFTDKVGNRDFKGAMHLLDQLEIQGEPFVRLLFMLARHFRLLLMANEGLSQKLGEREMAQKLKVNPYFVKDYLTQAKKINGTKLKTIFKETLNTDRLLKRSPLNPRTVMNGFLQKIQVER